MKALARVRDMCWAEWHSAVSVLSCQLPFSNDAYPLTIIRRMDVRNDNSKTPSYPTRRDTNAYEAPSE